QDGVAFLDLVADLQFDLGDLAGGRRRYFHRSLVGFEYDQGILRLDAIADLYRNLDHLDRIVGADIGYGNGLSAHDWCPFSRRRRLLASHRIAFVRIDAEALDCLRNIFRGKAALVGQRLERCDDDEVAIDLEVVTQFATRVAATEAVGAEHDVAVWNKRPQLLAERLHVIGCANYWAAAVFQQLCHIRHSGFAVRVQQIPAFTRCGFALQFVDAGSAPHIRADAEILAQNLGGGFHFAQDRAAAEQLHAVGFAPGILRFGEQIHAANDAFLDAHR